MCWKEKRGDISISDENKAPGDKVELMEVLTKSWAAVLKEVGSEES